MRAPTDTLLLLERTLDDLADRPYFTAHRGALCDNPAGGNENVGPDIAEHLDPEGWVAFNVGDYEPSRWDVHRERATQAGILSVPWARLGTPGAGATREACLARLRDVSTIADEWEIETRPMSGGIARPLLNAETELLLGLVTPADLATHLDGTEGGISTEANLYWSVDWTPVRDWPVLLQLFPEDMHVDPTTMKGITAWAVYGARTRAGMRWVGATYQAWRSDPAWFDRSGMAWSIAWAERVPESGGWEAWES